jgi:hypothetical protein
MNPSLRNLSLKNSSGCKWRDVPRQAAKTNDGYDHARDLPPRDYRLFLAEFNFYSDAVNRSVALNDDCFHLSAREAKRTRTPFPDSIFRAFDMT